MSNRARNMPGERPLTFQLDQDSLFKYCDARGVDILKSLRLKVSPPNQFNDPFEFLPEVDLCMDQTDLKKWLTDPKRIRSAWMKRGRRIPLTDFSIAYKAKVESFGPEQVDDTRSMLQEVTVRRQHGVVDSISKTRALACYSEIPDNFLMWSHYTDGHRGIVVEFDLKSPFFSPPANLMPVSYRSDRVSARVDTKGFAFDEHELSVVRTKSLAWSYEREWRQLFQLKDCTRVHNPKGPPSFYVSIPSDAIASVRFGVRCAKKTEMKVRRLKERPDLQHVRLWQALLHERDFKLNILPADDAL